MLDWYVHPDISLKVISRKVTEDLLEMLVLSFQDLTNPWYASKLRSCFPSQASYHNAMSRLRKQGLVARRRKGGRTATIQLTEDAPAQLAAAARPEAFWQATWSGRWHLLVYDVPETERHYRTTLRQFLVRMRMGYLQNSVWISPHDLRAEYDDLCKAASLQDFAFLFESRTVLNQGPEAIVRAAWDFDRIGKGQAWYLRETQALLQQVRAGTLAEADLRQAARRELDAYHAVMREDPLLPEALIPADYLGREAFALHQETQKAIARAL